MIRLTLTVQSAEPEIKTSSDSSKSKERKGYYDWLYNVGNLFLLYTVKVCFHINNDSLL